MNDNPYDLEFDWLVQEMGDDIHDIFFDFHDQTYEIRDLIKHEFMSNTKSPLKATLGVHDVLLIRLFNVSFGRS